MKGKNPTLTLTVKVTSGVAEYRALSLAGAYPAAGSHMHGVTDSAAATGNLVAVDITGTSIFTAGAAVGVDVLVEVGADGKFVPKVAGKAVARSMSAAAGDNALFEGLLLPSSS